MRRRSAAGRRRAGAAGGFADETLRRLVGGLGKTPERCSTRQTIDIVLTAHPTLDDMAAVSTEEYRSVMFRARAAPRGVLPCRDAGDDQTEHGRLNTGSQPPKRRPGGGGESSSFRAIPWWIFAWTQTRFHLRVWMGFGATFWHAAGRPAPAAGLATLRVMYD
ncbi:unnamed protein product [Urochloa humidicola]